MFAIHDLFDERTATAIVVILIAMWACPLVGISIGAWSRGIAFAGRWWPVLLVYYAVIILLVLVVDIRGALRPLLICGGTLMGPVVGLLLALAGLQPNRGNAGPACRNCGYNLTGNVTGICPECGEGM